MGHTKSKHSKQNSLITTLIIIILLITMFVSGFHILKWMKENRKSDTIRDEILNVVKKENEEGDQEGIIDFQKLKEENKKTVAWLKVENTNIEYPVVKSEDNNFYLNHSFDDSYNSAGWIFAECTNKFDGTDKNIVIFGHNRRDGSMFGTLKNILKSSWYKNEDNKYITLATEQGDLKYEVFSVYKVENEEYYITTKFDNNEEFEEFINTIKARSIYDFQTEVKKADKILTLSTCADNNKYRVVLHAKKVK